MDVHSHFVPDTITSRLDLIKGTMMKVGDKIAIKYDEVMIGPLPPSGFDLSARLREMDSLGTDVQVASPVHQLFMYKSELKVAKTICRAYNEGLSDVVKRSKGRLVGNAIIPLQDPQSSVEELEYAIMSLGHRGVEIGTNVAGKNLDDESLHRFYKKVEELGVPIFVHPNDILCPERHRKYYSPIVVGTLAETNLAILSVVFGGVLDAFPGLRFIFSHGGGGIPYQVGRLEHASKVRKEIGGLKRRVLDYLRSVYYDSVVFNRETLELLVRVVTPSRVVLGTDYPFDMGDFESHKVIEASDQLSDEEKRKILSGNATELYRI
ncbi:MAG: amidohydrolase [Aigarchaeota archaeon]|nr:amidohydrolase [Aigarchaeota archaeon]MDW8092732.1 amidohydrolase family protein [Nitrososphaerota archaeon]